MHNTLIVTTERLHNTASVQGTEGSNGYPKG